jgi:hypothetical protein
MYESTNRRAQEIQFTQSAIASETCLVWRRAVNELTTGRSSKKHKDTARYDGEQIVNVNKDSGSHVV